jgi:hypothetical protein
MTMATKKATGTKRTPKKVAMPAGAKAKARRPSGLKVGSGEAEGTKHGKRTAAAPASHARPAAASSRVARDPRLPEAGTVIRKLDRNGSVRCECTVEADGIRYGGQLYRSLSAAAVAAAADLGIKGAQNGYIFFGLSKPARPGEDPLSRLEKSWSCYEACARTVIATAAAERKPELMAAIERHRSVKVAAAA